VTGTKGRALDHIGFEVKDLEDFTKTLEANGVKLDTPYRKVPQMGFAVAFLTDPWGTRIELTERSTSPSAQGPKPRSNSPLSFDSEPEAVLQTGPQRGRKFYVALACYAAIAVLAALTLDGKFRWAVWIFLAGLALKTYIATLAKALGIPLFPK
jgi:hypothetical protein